MKRKLSRRIEAKLLRDDAACVSLPKPTMSNSWTAEANRLIVRSTLACQPAPRRGEERDICPVPDPVNHFFELFFRDPEEPET